MINYSSSRSNIADTGEVFIEESLIKNLGVVIAPNPFSSSTIIELTGANANARYSFVMYNVLGREVKNYEIRASKFKLKRGDLFFK